MCFIWVYTSVEPHVHLFPIFYTIHHSCVVHISQLSIGKTKSVYAMLKVLKECGDPRMYFDPFQFLDALQLDSLLPRRAVDTSLYVINRAELEQMYPYLSHKDTVVVAGVVYSTLKFTVSEEKDAKAVNDKCKQSPRHACQPLHMYMLMVIYTDPSLNVQFLSVCEMDGMP